ncbi:hypothetical protein BH09BAC1_BH09BAC1_09670 [soil metagenome]
MKYACLLLIWLPLFAFGQGKSKSGKSKLPSLSQEHFEILQKAELELNPLAFSMFSDTSNLERMRACYTFIPKFVEALKVPGSFAYPFDSVPILSLLYPADSSFRVITWQVSLEGGSYRYFGTIQMNKGKDLMLYPLIDRTDSIASPHDTLLSPKSWYGAFYYNMIETKAKGKTYYTLFGFDGNDLFSRVKLMDVLHFEEGKPVFGAPVFEIPDSISADFPYVVKKPLTRFMVYYKFDAKLTLNYNIDDKIVVFDHIKSDSEFGKDIPVSLIPDGSYDAFEWKNGKWKYISNVYEQTINRANPPLPDPSNDVHGNINQKKQRKK